MNHIEVRAVKTFDRHTVLDNVSPVSYTHLDVYKRQDIYTASQGATVPAKRFCSN